MRILCRTAALVLVLCLLLATGLLGLTAFADPEDPSETTPQPSETQPPAPTETNPPAPTETDPPAPTETDPPAPTETDPPAPTETDPPAPTETDPTEPTETDPPAPTETDPTEPTPTQPTQPTEPTPTQPTPTQPVTPTPTQPVTPTPTQPQPTSPPVREEERDPALIQGTVPEIRLPSDDQIEYKRADGTPYYQIPADWTAADVIHWFIVNYGLDQETFSIEFYCPETGERCGWNENTFMLAASTYKLPLNMYYYEKQNAGELSGDMVIGSTTLDTAHYYSIVHSMNDISVSLLYNLGNYQTYKSLMLQSYGGMDKSEVPSQFWSDNYYSAHFMLNTLSYLYDHLDEFEELHGYLLQAMQGRYLQKYRGSVEVAHKYGTLQGHENDVGIIFTEQPFLVAIYTQYVYSPVRGEELIGRIGAALIAYQEQRTELEKHPPEPSDEETDAPETTVPNSIETAPPETEAPAETPAPKPSAAPADRGAEPEPEAKTPWYFIAFPMIILAGAVGGILLFRKK